MAAPPSHKSVRAYPVWIGNLNEAVTEAHLFEAFSSLCDDGLISCRVMLDEGGKPKGFGYANFQRKDDAESVARVMNGYSLFGTKIKTKGPKLLRKEGHTKTKIPSTSPDYRPFTDCTFFMEGSMCKKGTKCLYRHSETAKASSSTCAEWLEKQCLNAGCAYKHPGAKETAMKDEALMVPATPASTFHKCGGRCGDAKCPALFVSTEDLTRHVKALRMPQCRHCRAIFPSTVEYQDHLLTCWARTASTTSTEFSSESADVEVLSDSDTDEFLDGEDPIDGGANSLSPVKGKGLSPVKGKGVVGKEKKGKLKDRGKEDVLFNGEEKNPMASSSSSGDVGGSPFYHSLYYEAPLTTVTTVENSSNTSESDSDDDEIVEYSRLEMAHLLSLNEQDILDSGSEEEKEKGAGKKVGAAGTSKKSAKPRKRAGGTLAAKEAAPSNPTPTHRTRLEPVGVFWDIETCSVPSDKSAFGVAAKMRREFIEGKREAEFMCVCDITKERKEVTNDLHKAQVTLVHVNAIAKNVADDKLRQSLRRFAYTYPAPATVVLISGDVNFSMELNDLMHLHDLTVVLVHNSFASDALKVFATRLVNYEDFIRDVDPPSYQTPNLSRIVVVSNLPKHVNAEKISHQLDRISDSCGGKVVSVDKNAGKARVLFRTNDWAKKSMKRMRGENVYGNKIETCLESPPPQSQLKSLSGDGLNKSFPPVSRSIGSNHMGPRTPPTMHRPGYPPPSASQPPPYGPMPHQRGIIQPPPPPISPYPQPPPLMSIRPPLLIPAQPRPSILPPPPVSMPRFPTPPCGNPQSLRKGGVPRPEGKILVFKIPPFEEPSLQQNIHVLQASALLSAEVLLLWHSYGERQVVLRLDFMQTAVMRKEEIIHTLYENGDLKAEVASKFVETCTKSVLDVLRRHQMQWDVTTCGWSAEEEESRIIRSNVISLLRKNSTCWTKFSNFKKRYFEAYSSAISEMTIHNACGGAVQILGDRTQTQIIIFCDFSPLVKIQNNDGLHAKLKGNFHKLLSMQANKKIKLLDFVTAFNDAKLGALPTSSSGKMLQEIITSMPDVTLVGNKPSNIYVTLGGAGTAA